MTRIARPLAALTASLSLVTVVLTGCGGSSAPGGDTATPTTTYAQCMRDHDVDMADPDPSTGVPQFGEGVHPDDPAVKQAMAACQSLLPAGSRGTPNAADLDVYVAFAQCMRANGLPNFPDPQPGSGGDLFAGADVNRDDPTFQHAAQQCQDILGKAGS